MENLFAIILLIILAPVLLAALVQVFGMAIQITATAFAITLPWFILFIVLIALGAGAGAGFVLRDRLPPRPMGELPPPGGTIEPIRRAPQIVHQEDDDHGGLR